MTLVEALSLMGLLMMLAALPTASSLLVAARSTKGGFAQGVSAALGVVLGDIFFISVTLFGLAALASTLGPFFTGLKYLGAAYLLWLGYGLLTHDFSPQRKEMKKSSLIISCLAGLLITLGDMKAIFFYVSLFPAFIDSNNITVTDAIMIMVIDFIAVGGAKLGYAYVGSVTSLPALGKASRYKKVLSMVAGISMILIAIMLIVNQIISQL